MPAWLFRLLMVVSGVLFMFVCYFFGIRPYAYRWKPCAGCRAYGVCMPVGYAIHGIDVSHYQERIDWAALSQAQTSEFPLCFAFIKATEGGDLADECFAYNFDEARRNGFIRGAYHFFIPSTPPEKQADFFIRTVRLESGDLPPVLDVEQRGQKTAAELQADVRKWLELVERHYGVKPILYTSYRFKQKYLSDSIFDAYPYWIAHYYVDAVRYEGPWLFWQHTDVGSLPGIRHEVDLNVFRGSREQLQQLTLR